jgi:hypothetical protein
VQIPFSPATTATFEAASTDKSFILCGKVPAKFLQNTLSTDVVWESMHISYKKRPGLLFQQQQ